MSSIRTFLAVELSQDVRLRAADLIGRLQDRDTTVRWVEPENMHLTVKFLGDVDERNIGDVCSATATAVSGLAPFRIECRGAGAFPSPARPRTLWIGLSQGQDEMIGLNRAIEDALTELGFRKEHRQFHPHLTIGRVRGAPHGLGKLAKRIEDNVNFEAGRSDISEVIIFASQLTRDGPIHNVLGRAPLEGAPG